MRTRSLLASLSLGAVLSVATAAVAVAQPGGRLIICRDGAQAVARNASVCAAHGGVDGRATEYARRTGTVNNGGYPGGVYSGVYNGTYDPRYGAPNVDPEFRRREAEREAARARALQRDEARREAIRREAERREHRRDADHGDDRRYGRPGY